jgi:hypothetical protein
MNRSKSLAILYYPGLAMHKETLTPTITQTVTPLHSQQHSTYRSAHVSTNKTKTLIATLFLLSLAGCNNSQEPPKQEISPTNCDVYGVPGCHYLHRAPEEDEIKSSVISPIKINLSTSNKNIAAYTSRAPRIFLNEVAIGPTGEMYAVGGTGLAILRFPKDSNEWKINEFSGWGDSLRGIVFTEDGAGFAVGSSARVFQTTDSGSNWKLYNPGFNKYDDPHLKSLEYTFARSAFAVDFFDIHNGLMVGEEFILSTHNGGKDWHRVNIKVDGIALQKLSIVDKNTAWAVGSNGTILVTADKGITWKHVKLIEAEDVPHLMGVSFTSTTSGCIGGEHRVWCTSNAGDSWAQAELQPVPYGSVITNLKMQDDNNGWFINRAGGIYKTENGGKKWSRWLRLHEVVDKKYTNAELWGLALDANSVWAVGMVIPKGGNPNVVNLMNPLIIKWDAK